jgi:Zn ribbon nucleic-acid-binding protein
MEEMFDCPICETDKSVVALKMQGVNTRICQSCGYQTNEGMVESTDLEKSIYESQPELFKDLKIVDNNQFVWYPTILNEVNKTMLFPDGKNSEDWGWRVAQYVPLTKKDKALPGQTHKLDMANSTLFPPLMFSAALYLYSTFLRDDNEV